MNENLYQEILDTLKEKFPDKILLSPEDIGTVYDIATTSIYNKSSSRFTLPPIGGGGRPRWRIYDVARDLATR
ncbi:hypothetical protein [uncultured Desulfosarcina sp.]|uniref:hypothetical protein n=1 Tax=uncultured Desulfosarcina sp. TaxID=218289 RepID=UPI0029C8E601|nr:hypothetical protein [uncultured Desulfosarcina sp.]